MIKNSETAGDLKSLKDISQTNGVDSSKKREVIFCKTSEKKNNMVFANINHKNSFGANNWNKFKELQPGKNSATFSKTKGEYNRSRSSPRPQAFNKTNNIKSSVSFPLLGNTTFENRNATGTKFQIRPKDFGDGIPKSIAKQQPLVEGNSLQRARVDNKLLLGLCENFTVVNPIKEPFLTKQIAMDCEMVGVEVGVNNNMLARVSLVNALGNCIYDKYVKPTEPVVDYRTRFSGVRPKDLENAEHFKTVQKEVADILKGRILVGHALKNDLSVLFLTHPKRAMRDTSKYQKFRSGRTPALKKLALKYLGVKIQEGEHSSIQDALAAMQLYRMFRKEWEASLWPSKKQKNQELRNKSTRPSISQPIMDV